MKRIFTILTIVLLSTAVMIADEIVKLDGLYYSLGDTEATLVKDQSSDQSTYKDYTEVTIPSEIKYNNYTYPVKTIGISAFEGCKNLQSVTLPSSIKAIYTDAFYGCTKLGSINLPEGLTTIYKRAFYNCNLTSITIPSTVTSMGNGAFNSNPLTSVVWKPKACSIGTDSDAPFYSSASTITSFTFGDQVETVPAYLCQGMSKIEEIVLPPSVKSLGQNAFMNCTSLKSINLPVTQKTLPVSFFEGCSALESIELPATLTTISQDAFYGCKSLAEINLHEGITTIGNRAFYNCKLTSVTIPSSVTSMGNGAFNSNPLTSIVWKPVKCTTIGTDSDAPFYSSASTITSFTFGDQVEEVSVYLCQGMSKIEEIVLPPSVKSLGKYAFASCTSLKSINLPVTQKTLPVSFFEGCSALKTIELPSTLTTISQNAFYGCSSLAEIDLHEGITTIGNGAFYNCKLTSVTIPSTVTSMGNGAFNSNPLTSVVWKPVKCTTIGTDSSAPFYSSASTITSFTFGDQVEEVPAYLCKGMSKIEEIVLPPSVKSLGQNAFASCTSLKSINLPVTQKTLPVSFFEGCSALEAIELPATLTTISQDAFYGCSSLAEINLHEGITTIGNRAFYNCKLTSVTIPSTVTSMGNGAFNSNPLKSVVWKPKTCSIGTDSSAPFYGSASTITSFTFSDLVETVPGYLCKNMSKLESVLLPATVTSVGQQAFMNCTALKKLEFPKGIKTVATSVLEGCSALEEVIIPATVTTINQDAFYGCRNLQAIRNYAITPQSITERAVNSVDKKTCILYVPMDYLDLYSAKAVWCDFKNIIGVATDLQFEEQIVNLSYLRKDESLLYMESQKWEIPHAPRIEGFVFEKWEVLAGDLNDGVKLQAVYKADEATGAPAQYVNPANKAQKLIRRGNVYVLQDGKTYTVNGSRVE